MVGRTFLEDMLIHRSARGDRMLVGADGTPRWPDFTIEDRNGQTWAWEHCGMLDQPDYAARWKAKLDWYGRNKIIRWSPKSPNGRLIVTEDGPSRGVDSAAIRALIKQLWGR